MSTRGATVTIWSKEANPNAPDRRVESGGVLDRFVERIGRSRAERWTDGGIFEILALTFYVRRKSS